MGNIVLVFKSSPALNTEPGIEAILNVLQIVTYSLMKIGVYVMVKHNRFCLYEPSGLTGLGFMHLYQAAQVPVI